MGICMCIYKAVTQSKQLCDLLLGCEPPVAKRCFKTQFKTATLAVSLLLKRQTDLSTFCLIIKKQNKPKKNLLLFGTIPDSMRLTEAVCFVVVPCQSKYTTHSCLFFFLVSGFWSRQKSQTLICSLAAIITEAIFFYKHWGEKIGDKEANAFKRIFFKKAGCSGNNTVGSTEFSWWQTHTKRGDNDAK